MFSLNGTLIKSGSVGRWETKQFIGMALVSEREGTNQVLWKGGIGKEGWCWYGRITTKVSVLQGVFSHKNSLPAYVRNAIKNAFLQ